MHRNKKERNKTKAVQIILSLGVFVFHILCLCTLILKQANLKEPMRRYAISTCAILPSAPGVCLHTGRGDPKVLNSDSERLPNELQHDYPILLQTFAVKNAVVAFILWDTWKHALIYERNRTGFCTSENKLVLPTGVVTWVNEALPRPLWPQIPSLSSVNESSFLLNEKKIEVKVKISKIWTNLANIS